MVGAQPLPPGSMRAHTITHTSWQEQETRGQKEPNPTSARTEVVHDKLGGRVDRLGWVRLLLWVHVRRHRMVRGQRAVQPPILNRVLLDKFFLGQVKNPFAEEGVRGLKLGLCIYVINGTNC